MNPQEPTPEIKIQKQNKFEELIKKLGWKKIIAGGVVFLILIVAIFVSLGLAIINQQNYKISISSPVSLSYPSYPKKPVNGIIKDFDYLYTKGGQLIAGFKEKESQAFDLPQEHILNFDYNRKSNLIAYTNAFYYQRKEASIEEYMPAELYVLNLADNSIKQIVKKDNAFGTMCSKSPEFYCDERFVVPAYKFNHDGTKLAYVYNIKSYVYDLESGKSYELKDAAIDSFVVREFIWSENDDLIVHAYYEGEQSTVFRYRNGNYNKVNIDTDSKIVNFDIPNYIITGVYPHYGAEGFSSGTLLTSFYTAIAPVSYVSQPVSRTIVHEDKEVPHILVWEFNMDNGKAREIYNNNKEEKDLTITPNGYLVELLPSQTLNVYKGTQKVNSIKVDIANAGVGRFADINDYVILVNRDTNQIRLTNIFTGDSYKLDGKITLGDRGIKLFEFTGDMIVCLKGDYLNFGCKEVFVIEKGSKMIKEL